jgi:hypothetical protein
MADEPKDENELVVKVAKEATADWLVDAGKIKHQLEFDVKKNFADYEISLEDLSDISKTVEAKIKRSTGRVLALPENWHESYHSGSVQKYIAALPGWPHTLPGGPLPGKPRTLPTTPTGKGSGSSGSNFGAS